MKLRLDSEKAAEQLCLALERMFPGTEAIPVRLLDSDWSVAVSLHGAVAAVQVETQAVVEADLDGIELTGGADDPIDDAVGLLLAAIVEAKMPASDVVSGPAKRGRSRYVAVFSFDESDILAAVAKPALDRSASMLARLTALDDVQDLMDGDLGN